MHWKKLGLLRRTADSRSGAGNIQDEPEISFYTRKQENYQGQMGLCQKSSVKKWDDLRKTNSVSSSMLILNCLKSICS